MDCIRLATRPWIRHFVVLGVMAVLPATGAYAQTPTKNITVAPTIVELASLTPIPVESSRLLSGARQSGSPGSQQRGWIGRHPVLFGALVGVAPGVVFGEYQLGRKGDMPHGPDMLVGAGIGAGLGSLVGLVVGLAR
jgi:hypothetical protein